MGQRNALRSVTGIGRAKVTGDAVGSSQLTFEPGSVTAGNYHFAIGTAGSTALVLHTVYLPLALAGDDLIGQARTGMGKTLAFGVQLLQRITTDT